jgi:hypothetical protein
MKLYINPQYECLRSDINKVLEGNYVATEVFCHKRNVVERFTMQGREYVIKIYRQPNCLNRVAYTFLRKSKAVRAYSNALRLIEMGIDTPVPVAYAEKRSCGLFKTGYFISEYLPHRLLRDMPAELESENGKEQLTRDFVNFALEMHGKGVLPLDFNSSNIFYHYDEKAGRYRFAITDINRMRFGKTPTTSEVMRSFEQFGVKAEGLYKLAVYYCGQKGSDIEYSIFMFLFHRIISRTKKRLKQRFKEKKVQAELT